MLTRPRPHSMLWQILGDDDDKKNDDNKMLMDMMKEMRATIANLENEVKKLQGEQRAPAAVAEPEPEDEDPQENANDSLVLLDGSEVLLGPQKFFSSPLTTPNVDLQDIDAFFDSTFPLQHDAAAAAAPRSLRKRTRAQSVSSAITVLEKLIGTMNITAQSRSRLSKINTRAHMRVATTSILGVEIAPCAFDVTPAGAVEFYSAIQGSMIAGSATDALESVLRATAIKQLVDEEETMARCVDVLARAAIVELVGVDGDRVVHESVEVASVHARNRAALDQRIDELERTFSARKRRIVAFVGVE